jgi:uncharacterized protein YsxB (DUF464 family)
MAKTKVRGGAKSHRKKVEARNNNLKAQQNAMQKLMTESMRTQIEELKKKYEAESGATITTGK